MAKTSLKVKQSRPQKFKVIHVVKDVDVLIAFIQNSVYVEFVLEN